MFFADQVDQLLDVFPIIKVKSIQIVRKALFFKLIYTLIYTRSFSRGFSLATSSYVLGGRTALIAAKLYCGLGNYSQTAIFPRMPSITDYQACYHGFALGSWVHRVGKIIKEQNGEGRWIRTIALQIFVPLQLSLLISDLWSGLSLHHDISVLDDRR